MRDSEASMDTLTWLGSRIGTPKAWMFTLWEIRNLPETTTCR